MPAETGTSLLPEYETEVILHDGTRIRLRPIRTDDTERWLVFLSRVSEHTKYLRFHNVPRTMELEDAVRFCTVDYNNTFAVVAEVVREKQPQIVAIGRYYRLPSAHSAEVAIIIDDPYQDKGIGTKIIEYLANIARGKGINTFEADVLVENETMMQAFNDYGFHITSERSAGEYHVVFPIARTGRVIKKEEMRERIATVSSLRPILSPSSVAIIGASRYRGTIGNSLLESILHSGYTGTVYPVNPNTQSVMAVKSYPSILDVPGEVDLAIIAVPAKLVNRVADECGRKGVRAVIVISDGFRERDAEGEIREKELKDITLGYGMRLVGPNCMGVINTDREISLNGTFSPIFPPAGNVAFLSQSGAMGLTILEYARNLNMGISTFISVGNRADVSSNDLLQYWEQDPATRVILLYMESFGNPRKFGRIARRLSARKPIVAVKSGSTPAGSRAASSHTGALATSDIASDVLFRHAGIIRVNAMEELFDVATLLSTQPLPKGRRLFIVTNGGGPGIMAADAASRSGLIVPELSPATAAKLQSVVRRDIRLNNPIDITAGAQADEYHNIMKILASDDDIDAVLAIFIPPVAQEVSVMEDAIRSAIPDFTRNKKPLMACFLGQRGYKATLGHRGRFIPCYPFPEEAVSALAKAVEYAELRQKPAGKVPRLSGLKPEKARRLIETALARSTQRPLWLSMTEIAQLLGYYGIHFIETSAAGSADEAAAAAAVMDFPVTVKLASSSIVHKTDVGGVILNLQSESEVKEAFNTIRSRLADLGRADEMEGVIIQEMVSGGLETIAGVTQDPTFGPLIMFGLGGIYAELLKDIALKLHPLTDLDARELVNSVKMARMFAGYRGQPASDVSSLEDMLLRLSALVEDIPQIAELDLNPVKVMPQGEGYQVVDARIMVK